MCQCICPRVILASAANFECATYRGNCRASAHARGLVSGGHGGHQILATSTNSSNWHEWHCRAANCPHAPRRIIHRQRPRLRAFVHMAAISACLRLRRCVHWYAFAMATVRIWEQQEWWPNVILRGALSKNQLLTDEISALRAQQSTLRFLHPPRALRLPHFLGSHRV